LLPDTINVVEHRASTDPAAVDLHILAQPIAGSHHYDGCLVDDIDAEEPEEQRVRRV
jgi:hypothetical protein